MTFEQRLELAKLILEFLKVLVWPSTFITALILFRANLRKLLSNISKAELPWGVGTVEFNRDVAELSIQANQPDHEKIARDTPARSESTLENYNPALIQRGLQPTKSGLDLNYFRRIAAEDPNLALAALRMEIETLVSNLAVGFNVSLDKSPVLGRALDSLKAAGAITTLQHRTARTVIGLCNRAIHGQAVDTATALAIIDSVKPLMDDYKAWLDWGFPAVGVVEQVDE